MPIYQYSASEREPNSAPTRLTADKGLQLLPISTKVVFDICHSTESKVQLKSTYIGLQVNHALLFQFPKSKNIVCSSFLPEGNIINVKAVSTQGEGIILSFKTTILRLYPAPFPMLATSIPESIQLQLIRKEPRFNMDLAAKMRWETSEVNGEIEDISCNGCCFVTSELLDDLKKSENADLIQHCSLQEKNKKVLAYNKIKEI